MDCHSSQRQPQAPRAMTRAEAGLSQAKGSTGLPVPLRKRRFLPSRLSISFLTSRELRARAVDQTGV